MDKIAQIHAFAWSCHINGDSCDNCDKINMKIETEERQMIQ